MKYLYLALLTSFSINFLQGTEKSSSSKIMLETNHAFTDTESNLIQDLDYQTQVIQFFKAHQSYPILADLTIYLEKRFPGKTLFEVLNKIPLSDLLPILYNNKFLIKENLIPHAWRYALYYYHENLEQNSIDINNY